MEAYKVLMFDESQPVFSSVAGFDGFLYRKQHFEHERKSFCADFIFGMFWHFS